MWIYEQDVTGCGQAPWRGGVDQHSITLQQSLRFECDTLPADDRHCSSERVYCSQQTKHNAAIVFTL
jgi:hypothetical protein